MKIDRFFTRNLATPYEGITFEARKSEIKTMDGSLVSKVKKAVVPSFWSDQYDYALQSFGMPGPPSPTPSRPP